MKRFHIGLASVVISFIAVRVAAQTCSQCAPTLHSGFTIPTVISISVFGTLPNATQASLNEAMATWNAYLGQIGSTTRFQLLSNNNSSAIVGVYLDPTLAGTLWIAINQGALVANNGSSNLLVNPDFASNLDIMEPNMLHELGHNLGFEDVDTSGCKGLTVMYGALGQNSATDLTDCDRAVVTSCYSPGGSPGGGGGDPMNQCTATEGCAEPLLIRLDLQPYRLTGLEDPVMFDINADGRPDTIGWTAADSNAAFLALDRNHNGTIDNGAELFGDATRLSNGTRAGNGFIALEEWDGNHDGVLDSSDSIWPSLLLWTDRNHDGVSQPDELQSIAVTRITAIEVAHHWTGRRDRFGNRFGYEALLHEGKATRAFYDVFFIH